MGEAGTDVTCSLFVALANTCTRRERTVQKPKNEAKTRIRNRKWQSTSKYRYAVMHKYAIAVLYTIHMPQRRKKETQVASCRDLHIA